MEIVTLITIGIALSMDAFSVALGIGTIGINNKKYFQISLVVGIMHFIMPLLGLLLGEKIINFLHLEAHILMAGILLLIAFEMIRSTILKEKEEININKLGIIAYAISVSFDSFSTGIGITSITNHIILSCFIFSIFSFTFTLLGLYLGKYSRKMLGIYANLAGAVLLIIIAISSFIV